MKLRVYEYSDGIFTVQKRVFFMWLELLDMNCPIVPGTPYSFETREDAQEFIDNIS